MAMLCSLAVVPAQATGAEENWYDEAMNLWAERNVLKGDAQGDLHPTAPITRAELAAMLDRIMGYQTKAENTFSDVAEGAWYTDAVLKANAAGILKGDTGSAGVTATARPEATITRQEAMVMLARVMELTGGSAVTFTDAGEIAPWALDAVKAMTALGYVQGSDGRLRPNDTITRAEVATLLKNLFPGYYSVSGTYTENVTGSAVISADGTVLKDLSISGDLIIAEGVGEGHVELDGLTLGGRLIVRGGGANSVIIKGNSSIASVLLSRQDGAIRLSVEGNADVSAVVIDDGSDSVKIEGSVGSVTVDAPNVTVAITGTVKNLSVTDAATGAALTTEKGSNVSTLTVAGENTSVTVGGTVSKVEIADTAVSTTLTAEKGSKVSTLTTAGTGTTVQGAGTVSKVEAAAGATDTTVNTSGTKVQNSSSEAVSSGTGTVAPGKTGTTTGETSKPTTGNTGSSSSDDDSGPSYTMASDEAALRAAAANGGHIRLGSDITLNRAALEIAAGKNVVLDLNGKTLTATTYKDNKDSSAAVTSTNAILVQAAGSLTLNDTVGTGKVTLSLLDESVENQTFQSYTTRPVIQNDGTLVLNGGTITVPVNAYYGLGIDTPTSFTTINTGATIDCAWGANEGEGVAIASNGKVKNNGYTLTINGGTIRGGEQAMYLPSAGTVTVNGGIISGTKEGIELRSGTLIINDGTITASAARKTDVSANNGATGNYTGALVVVKPASAKPTGYHGDINVSVNGGSLVNNGGDALCVSHEEGTVDYDIKVALKSAAAITGGMNIQDGFGAQEGDSLTLDGAAYVFSADSLRAAARSAGTIILAADITSPSAITFSGKENTLNLNGKKLSITNVTAIEVENGANLTICDNSGSTSGEVNSDGNHAVMVSGNVTPGGAAVASTLTVSGGTLTGKECGVYIRGSGAVLTVNGGTIIGRDNAGVSGNGTKNSTNDFGGTRIVINDGTITGQTQTDGYRNCGLYHPQAGELMIHGGTITGESGAGIVIRSGSLTMDGGTVAGNGTGGEDCKMGDTVPTYCGGIEVGYSSNYPGGMGNITISGGTITSERDQSFRVLGTPTSESVISITGGTFTPANTYSPDAPAPSAAPSAE